MAGLSADARKSTNLLEYAVSISADMVCKVPFKLRLR